ncbi:hypothetical protein ABKN59_004792 [Abortiporus biennis]
MMVNRIYARVHVFFGSAHSSMVALTRLRTPVKRALSIAIQYNHFAEFSPSMVLSSVGHDTRRVCEMLIKTFHWNRKDITILRDNGKFTPPTRDNMIRAMKALVDGAMPGDHFVFHFSGHGSQVPNDDGLDYEEDGKDEILWASDVVISDFDDPENSVVKNYIKDDELKQILIDPLPAEAHLTLIFDACHSGTAADLSYYREHLLSTTPIVSPLTPRLSATRPFSRGGAVMAMHRESSDSDHTDPEIYSPMGLTLRIDTSALDVEGSVSIYPTVTSWSACHDSEWTYEEKGGIFIKAFTRALTKPNQSYASLLRLLTMELKKSTDAVNEKRPPYERYSPPRPQLGSLTAVEDLLQSTILF